MSATQPIHETSLKSLKLLHRGKVRDLYAVDAERLLIVQTDRLSAFDVILPTPVPGKGRVLTEMSNFWFRKLRHVIPNHLLDVAPETLVAGVEGSQVQGRSFVVRRLQPLPIEAIVRGYIAGSGWKDYQKTQMICGIPLPAGLKEAQQLPRPIFTPSTKAAIGTHDENIPFSEMEKLIGKDLAGQVRDKAIQLYSEAAAYAAKTAELRIFPDDKGRMNRDVREAGGALLVVSQFTLAASTRRGLRPSFDAAEEPGRAKELYLVFVGQLRQRGLTVATGAFGAMMDVELVNDGPVTILLDPPARKVP